MTALIRSFLLLFALISSAQAATLTVSPASGQTGAQIRIIGDRLSPNVTYQLLFVSGGSVNLGSLTASALGKIAAAITLPALPAGRGELQLRAPMSLLAAARAEFTALTSMSAVLPASAHSGQLIPIEISGLQPGSVMVSFAGGTVLGPIAVSGGTYRGKFSIPRDRPTPLPADAQVRISNRVGRVTVNELTRTINVQPATATPLSFRIGQGAPGASQPGLPFVSSGGLDMVANEVAPDTVSLWFFGAGGQVYPLASAAVNRQGNEFLYQAQARAAGIAGMTAGQNQSGSTRWVAASSDTHDARRVTMTNAQTYTPLPSDVWRLRVRLRNQNNAPIAGAIVLFDGAPVVSEIGDDGIGALQALSIHQSAQVINLLSQVPATDSQGCPLALDRRLTDANGEVTFLLDDETLALFGVTTRLDINTVVRTPSLVLGVNASAQGYGFQYDSGPLVGQFRPHEYWAQFIGSGDGVPTGDQLLLYDNYNPTTLVFQGSRDATLTITMNPIQPRILLYDVAMVPTLAFVGPSVPDQQGTLSFGPTHNQKRFPNPLDVQILGGNDYPSQMSVRTDPAVTGQIVQSELRLDLDRNGTYESVRQFQASNTPLDCSLQGLTSSKTWYAPLNLNLKTQDAGAIKGQVVFRGSQAAGQYTRPIEIKINDRNLQWLANSRYDAQRISVEKAGQFLRIYAEENQLDSQVQLPSDPGYQIGQLRSATDHQEVTEIEYGAAAEPLLSTKTLFGENRALNRPGSGTLSEPEVGADSPPTTTTIIDQSFPLFYYVWGIPILAGVEFGANFALLAKIMIDHDVAIVNNRPQTTLRTEPEVDMGLDFYLDLDVLFDLVDGGVDLFAGVTLNMPVVVTNGVVSSPGPTIAPSLVFSYYLEFFCLPLDVICDALNDINGTEVLLPSNSNPKTSGSGRPRLFDSRTDRALAYSPDGDGMLIYTVLTPGGTASPKLYARSIDGADFGRARTLLSDAPGIRSLAITYFSEREAVAVWAESRDSYATLKTLRPLQRLARQRLMYATWDGEVWSAKSTLTAAAGGDGGVSLAACMSASCPAGGEVLAAWTRDMVGDMAQQRTRIYTSRLLSRGWTAAQPVDASALLDSSPSAAYVGIDPYVAFVRNPTGNVGQTGERRIAYRNLRSGTVQVPAELPGSVAWPSIAPLPSGGFVIAHTHSDDAQAFVGNTQRVALAFGDNCNSGVCALTAQRLTDDIGRPIYGEHPSPLIDDAGNVSIVMRGMGFGANQNSVQTQPNDPIGMVLHTGELVSMAVSRGQAVTSVLPLTNDGAGYVSPVGAFDPSIGEIVIAAQVGTPVSLAMRGKLKAAGITDAPVRASKVLADGDFALVTAEQGLDLMVENIRLTPMRLVAGQTVSAAVRIRNAGGRYTATGGLWEVLLSLDAPHAAGTAPLATRALLAPIPSGGAFTSTINFTVPAGFQPDQQHVVYAQLAQGTSPTADVNANNDLATLKVGGLPQVYGVAAEAVPGGTVIAVRWQIPPDTSEIAGYRVWYHDGDGRFKHLGSSFQRGFLDVSARPGVTRHYRVTSYSARAVESTPSDSAVARVVVSDAMFRNGFE